MKVLRSSLFRAICAMIVGALLIKYREQTVQWITIAIGIMFFLSGIVSLATYYTARKSSGGPEVYNSDGELISGGPRPALPIVGVGSVILGAILALIPDTFINSLILIIAALLIIGAISQFINLAAVRKFAHIGFFYWLMPSVILLTGIIAIIYPDVIATAPLFVIGWCMLLYGVVECMNSLKIHSCQKQMAKQRAEQAAIEVQDETKTEEQQTE